MHFGPRLAPLWHPLGSIWLPFGYLFASGGTFGLHFGYFRYHFDRDAEILHFWFPVVPLDSISATFGISPVVQEALQKGRSNGVQKGRFNGV